MAKIAITGGAGFIGSQLGYKFTKQGHQVLLIDNMSYGKLDNLIIDGEVFGQFVGEDVRSNKLKELFKGVDYVYHLAAIAPLPDCQRDPYGALDNNVSGTANVLEAARWNGVKKVIFASTSAVYENNVTFPCREQDSVEPSLVYPISKLQSEQLCKVFNDCYGLNYTILRFFNVYGPHQDFQRKQPPLIGYVIKQLMLGQTPVLHSDGNQKRDYVYVDDLVNLCTMCMENTNSDNQTFNVASGLAYSVRDIYSTIAKYMCSDIEPFYRDAALFWDKYPELGFGELPLSKTILEKEVNKYALGSYAFAEKKLGWKPLVSLDEGLKNSVDYALKMGLKND